MAPLLVGVIPFGLVAGAAPVDADLGGGIAIGLSTIVFAGASQLAMVDVLGSGGSVFIAVLTAWTINLRLMLYSASLSPFLAKESLHRRTWVAYLLTDQAYAVSITRWSGGGHAAAPERRLPFYFGAALALWVNWQICTIVGVLIGSAIPDSLPIEFAVPLVFLVLLVPTLSSSPAVVAAIFGGGAAVVCAELGGEQPGHRRRRGLRHHRRGGRPSTGGTALPSSTPAARTCAGRGPGRRPRRFGRRTMSRLWVAVILGGIGTFSMRASFLMAAHRMADVPPVVQRILRQIPPAALASIVVPAFLRPDGHFSLWTPSSPPAWSPPRWRGRRGTPSSPSWWGWPCWWPSTRSEPPTA